VKDDQWILLARNSIRYEPPAVITPDNDEVIV
jgi:hypothetical protein